ncbi:MAG: amidohydrolase family protein [Vampirovibrionales bacterium]|nr:amidohydrolase family protein [Vampirovibrionales bacterium]
MPSNTRQNCYIDHNGSRFWLAKWLLPVESNPIEDGFVESRSGVIVNVGRYADLDLDTQTLLTPLFEQAVHQNWLLTPGLINAHTHLEQSVGKVAPSASKAPDMAAWLLEAKPILDKLNDPEVLETWLQRGITETVACGTTFVNDISRNGKSLEALETAGLRAIVSLEFFHPDTHTLHETLLKTVVERYQKLQNQYRHHPRLRIGLSPHSPYNVSPNAWRWVLEKTGANQSAVLIHTHLAESLAETAYLSGVPSQNGQQSIDAVHQAYVGKTFGASTPAQSPTQYLADHHLLCENLIAAHAVYTDAQDRSLLSRYGVCVVHCPRSNQYLQGETLNWEAMRSANIRMALGSDGHLSTPGLDLRAEGRIARILHDLSASEVLALLTQKAAELLQSEQTLGTLFAGKSADMALWRYQGHKSELSPEEQFLAAQTECVASWVEGNPIFEADL